MLVAAAKDVDKEQRWGLLDGREIHARCIEYHEGKAITYLSQEASTVVTVS